MEEDIVIVGGGIAGLTTSLGLHRKLLLEALANELPSGTIRYMSRVVAIQDSGFSKILHLHDGTTIKTKVLIGSDGINSIVAKYLGFNEASPIGRYATRGYVELKNTHKLEPLFMQYFGKGFRAGVIPCDHKGVYWFFTWTPTIKDNKKELTQEPAKVKEYVLNKLEKMPSYVRSFIENTELDAFHLAPLRQRNPWELIMKNISKGNVCVVGDALHPMAPDLAQRGCSILEDGVVLARCLGEVFSKSPKEGEEEYKMIEESLKKYAKERRWRCMDLIARSYIVGSIQQSGSKLVNFFRDKILATFLAQELLKKSNFDCGQLK